MRRIRDLITHELHERIPLVFGAADKVERVARYYAGTQGASRMSTPHPIISVTGSSGAGTSYNEATCLSAIQHGFTSVMMDGSLEADGKTPADSGYNLAITGKVAEFAHAVGVSVEGELGCLGSLETGMGEAEDGQGAEGKLAKEQLLTDPDQALDFVARTKVDALAVAIGTSHGAYKFSRQPTGDILAMDVIRAIHERLPETHMVMHGSSSVPQDLQDIINE